MDFYPNGGSHQAGCNDVCMASICTESNLWDLFRGTAQTYMAPTTQKWLFNYVAFGLLLYYRPGFGMRELMFISYSALEHTATVPPLKIYVLKLGAHPKQKKVSFWRPNGIWSVTTKQNNFYWMRIMYSKNMPLVSYPEISVFEWIKEKTSNLLQCQK